MELTSLDVMERRVEAGAKRLDEVHGMWAWTVDPDMIEPMCEAHSVTGQLFGPGIAEQCRGVGIERPEEPTDLNIFNMIKSFTEFGFAVLCTEAVPVPQEVKDAMVTAARALGATADTEYLLSQIPEIMPIPRDRDVVLHEDAMLTELWRREVAKRRG